MAISSVLWEVLLAHDKPILPAACYSQYNAGTALGELPNPGLTRTTRGRPNKEAMILPLARVKGQHELCVVCDRAHFARRKGLPQLRHRFGVVISGMSASNRSTC